MSPDAYNIFLLTTLLLPRMFVMLLFLVALLTLVFKFMHDPENFL